MRSATTSGLAARYGVRGRETLFAAIACFLFAMPGARAEARFDNEKPVWEQIEELVCRGSHRLVCGEEICFKKVSKAQWRISFAENKIFKSGFQLGDEVVEYAEDIVAKDFAFYGDERGSRHVIYFSGRLMDFDMDNAALAGGDAVTARSLHYSWRKPLGFDWEDLDTSIETRFGCAPPGAPIEFVPSRTP